MKAIWLATALFLCSSSVYAAKASDEEYVSPAEKEQILTDWEDKSYENIY